MAIETYNIDPSHSGVHFSVRHLVIAKVRGSFEKFSGSFAFDPANVAASTVNVTVDAASISTREEKRDAHLKSADFFNVGKFPELTFKSRSVSGTAEELTVVGDLTMHGVTKEVKLVVEAGGAAKDPWGNSRLGFSAKASVNRADFGLKWNQVLEAGGLAVSEKIEIEIEISAIKAASAQAA